MIYITIAFDAVVAFGSCYCELLHFFLQDESDWAYGVPSGRNLLSIGWFAHMILGQL
jgi:hypothetical protein